MPVRTSRHVEHLPDELIRHVAVEQVRHRVCENVPWLLPAQGGLQPFRPEPQVEALLVRRMCAARPERWPPGISIAWRRCDEQARGTTRVLGGKPGGPRASRRRPPTPLRWTGRVIESPTLA